MRGRRGSVLVGAEGNLGDVLDNLDREWRSGIARATEASILQVNEGDYVAHLVGRFTVNVPFVDFDGLNGSASAHEEGPIMAERRLDRLARFMAHATTRRSAVKSIASGAIGGGALVAAVGRASADPEERSVLLYELYAAEIDSIYGDCGLLAAADEEFRQRHADLIAEVQAEHQARTPEEVAAHHARYGERLERATLTISHRAHQCGYEGGAQPALCADDGGGATPVARSAKRPLAAAAVPGNALTCLDGSTCNPDQLCPIDAGSCILYWGGCLGGGRNSCCWAGACTFGGCVTSLTASCCCSGVK